MATRRLLDAYCGHGCVRLEKRGSLPLGWRKVVRARVGEAAAAAGGGVCIPVFTTHVSHVHTVLTGLKLKMPMPTVMAKGPSQT